MTREELRAVLVETLSTIVPQIDAAQIDGDADLRDELDMDSMDLLNWIIALHQRLSVDIPELDAPKLATLNGAVDYLATRLGTT